MQSCSGKRPISENEDEENSPEYLQPAVDPYPSDDQQGSTDNQIEKGKNKTKGKKISKKQETEVTHTQHRTTISVARVIEAFDIRFLHLPQCKVKYPEMELMKVEEILDLFLPMIFKNVSRQEVLDSVLKLSDPPSTVLQILYDLKSYKVPEDYDGKELKLDLPSWYYKGCSSSLSEMTCQMKKIKDKLSSLHDDKETNSYQHAQLKDFFCHYLNICLDEGCRISGSCRFTFSLSSKTSSGKYETRKKCEMMQEKITAQPDLLIGYSEKMRQIPVEIYSPHKFKEKEELSSEFRPPETESGLSSEDRKDFVSLNNFLRKNMPNFMGANRCEGMLSCRDELTKQLVLQLLGTSHHFVNLCEGHEFQDEKKVFIGLLVCQFYVYILKMEGYEQDINKLGESVVFAKDSLNIQFVPLPLDIRNVNHGIALLFLLKYYRRIYS